MSDHLLTIVPIAIHLKLTPIQFNITQTQLNPPIGSMAGKLLRRRNKNPLVLVELPLYTQQHEKKIKIIVIIYHLPKVRTWLIFTFPGQKFPRKCMSHVSKWFSVQPYLHQTNRSHPCSSC